MAKRARPADHGDDGAHVFQSDEIKDRDSVFLGLYSPGLDAQEIVHLMGAVVEGAMHCMSASRRPARQKTLTGQASIYDTTADDDGEKYGGKTCLRVLDAMQVTGCVVVARWFGGTMLGPVRFRHIEAAAAGAVAAWKKTQAAATAGEPAAKKRVADAQNSQENAPDAQADARAAAQLVADLRQRDQSITVLRALLADKQAAAEAARTGRVKQASEDVAVASAASTTPAQTQSAPAASPAAAAVAAPDYAKMPLPALQRLGRARDATLGYLLKEINKAEQAAQGGKAEKLAEQGQGEQQAAPHTTAADEPAETPPTPAEQDGVQAGNAHAEQPAEQ